MSDRLHTARMDLFDAPVGSVLMHACSCQGVWGAGVAKTFRERFPKAYLRYQDFCRGPIIIGQALLVPTGQYVVGCLFTSVGYGQKADLPAAILENTDKALDHLFRLIRPWDKPVRIYSPRFNSGLFGVPWAGTESLVLKHLEANLGVEWTVAHLDAVPKT